MRVLHVVPKNADGGIPHFVNHQIKSLGMSIDNDNYFFNTRKISLLHPISTINEILNLRKYILASGADIIHSHWGSLLGALVCSIARKKKSVLTLRGSDINSSPEDSWFLNLIRNKLSRYATKRFDVVISVSDQIANEINELNSQIKVILDGTPLTIFYPRDRSSARTLLGWEQNRKYVLFYCGNRPIHKNLTLAEQTFSRLIKTFPNCELVIINQNFSQEALSIYMSGSNALLFTSVAEGSPNIVREAIACGCPVVTVPVGDVRKWVEMSDAGGVGGYDASSLADILRETLTKDVYVNTSIAQQYSLDNSKNQLLKIYRDLANSKS